MAEIARHELRIWPCLPQEMLDLIIDHSHGDLPTLRILAMVSHTWLESARRHIFYSVHVVPDVSDVHIRSLVEMGPRIRGLVRHLTLGRDISMTLHLSLIETMLAIMRHFPQLHSLTLSAIEFKKSVPNIVRESLPAAFPSRLRKLELTQIRGGPMIPAISDLLPMFTSISYLKLVRVLMSQEPYARYQPWHADPNFCSRMVPLDRLTIKYALLMEGWQTLVNVTKVKRLKIAYCTHVPQDELRALIKASICLTRLTVQADGRSYEGFLRPDDFSTKSSDLSTCSSLECLKIKFSLWTWRDLFDIFAMISTLPRPCALTNLVIRLTVKEDTRYYGYYYQSSEVYFENSMRNDIWRNAAPSLRLFPRLKTVRIEYQLSFRISVGALCRIQEWVTNGLALRDGCLLVFVWHPPF